MKKLKINIKFGIVNNIINNLTINNRIEQCFVLIGTYIGNYYQISKYAILTNLTDSYGYFEVPSYELNRIQNYSANSGYDLLIFCHSHPSGNLTASKLDIECMKSMNLPWIIFALDTKQNLKYALYLNGEEVPMEMIIEET